MVFLPLPAAFHQTERAQAYRAAGYRYEYDDYDPRLRPELQDVLVPCVACGEIVDWSYLRQRSRWYNNQNGTTLHMLPVCDWRFGCSHRANRLIDAMRHTEPLPHFYRGEMP